jgi:hypothetical protein
VEQHFEGLASPAEHHPVGLYLLEAGIPHQVPQRIREDTAPLDIL